MEVVIKKAKKMLENIRKRNCEQTRKYHCFSVLAAECISGLLSQKKNILEEEKYSKGD